MISDIWILDLNEVKERKHLAFVDCYSNLIVACTMKTSSVLNNRNMSVLTMPCDVFETSRYRPIDKAKFGPLYIIFLIETP